MVPVPGFPGYSLDETGTIYRADRPLKPSPNSKGYLRVFLRRDGATHTRYLHRLVCEAYHGAPSAGAEVRHLNGDKSINSPDNLAWGNRFDQAEDMDRHGTRVWGEAAPNSRITADIVRQMRDAVRAGASMKSAASQFGVPEKVAANAITGRRWSRLPGAVEAFATRRRFTAEQVREIRLMRGVKSEEVIARQFGVTRNAINQIMTRKSYAHVG